MFCCHHLKIQGFVSFDQIWINLLQRLLISWSKKKILNICSLHCFLNRSSNLYQSSVRKFEYIHLVLILGIFSEMRWLNLLFINISFFSPLFKTNLVYFIFTLIIVNSQIVLKFFFFFKKQIFWQKSFKIFVESPLISSKSFYFQEKVLWSPCFQ